MHRKYPGGKYRAVYEAGFCGFWIQRKLASYGISCIVASPADVPTTHKEKLSKTDTVDSRKLARELELARLSSIHIPRLEEQTLRSLCRLRHSLVKDSTRTKNRIKGFLNLYGYNLSKEAGRYWSGKYIHKLEEISGKLPGGDTLKHLVSILKETRKQITRCTVDLRLAIKASGKLDDINLLMKIPGIGFVTAATFVCEIMDVNRFDSFDCLASYVGLIPTMSDSGEKEQHTNRNPRGNALLNRALVESSWVAIRKDPAMLKKFRELSLRMKKQKAIIRIAKKLLSRINSVWKNRNDYVLSHA